MKYHDITTDDMKNGDGLRVVLWLSGCDHHCDGCHNKITWDPSDGIEFTYQTEIELFEKLKPDYISGLTLSGGDPFFYRNVEQVRYLLERMSTYAHLNNKTVWIYTGYTWEELKEMENWDIHAILNYYTDVLVDGPFIKELKDENYPWAGSTNQRVIDVKASLKEGKVICHGNYQEGWNYRRIQTGENCKCCE